MLISFWISFWVQGGCNYLMASTFFRFALIPRDDTMQPSNFSDDTPNTHFLGLIIILYTMFFRLHYHIINICFDISSDLSLQDDLNALLICSSPVLEIEHHLCVTEDSK
jgi:hypothetical protein